MNKTQFFTLSGALLASTALSGAASAGTIGKYDASGAFTTTSVSIANTVFSTTASTANGVSIGSATARKFGMSYSNQFGVGTKITTEFTLTGARFVQTTESLSNVAFVFATHSAGTAGPADELGSGTNSGSAFCSSVTALVELFVLNDCGSSATGALSQGIVKGVYFTGVNFNSASGLATAGSTVSLSGRVYNPTNTSQVFEATSTGTILTSVVPVTATVTAGDNVIASPTSTPTAFTRLQTAQAQETGTLSVRLATVTLTSSGAFSADLSTAVLATTAGTSTVTVTSTALSAASVGAVTLNSAGGTSVTLTTAATFNGGSVTFSLTNAALSTANSLNVTVVFGGTAAIPAAAAGTVSGTFQVGLQTIAASGVTANISQGGLRAEVNTFNASTNGPFASYLRIHNNGAVDGAVTITIRNDDHTSGAMLGSSFTTAAIKANSTMQLSAAEMEGTTTSTKLASGGANIPVESRTGSYTVSVTGPIVGYVQHILFDGNSVADLSGYRNSNNTSAAP